jgi:hypothetical protein
MMADDYYPPDMEGETDPDGFPPIRIAREGLAQSAVHEETEPSLDSDGFPPIRVARETPARSARTGRKAPVPDGSESDQGSDTQEQDISEERHESDDSGLERMTKRELVKEVYYSSRSLLRC